MIHNNASPMEHLAAFAIVLVAGVLSTVVLGKYLNSVMQSAPNATTD